LQANIKLAFAFGRTIINIVYDGKFTQPGGQIFSSPVE
jgi:hypothetical protein